MWQRQFLSCPRTRLTTTLSNNHSALSLFEQRPGAIGQDIDKAVASDWRFYPTTGTTLGPNRLSQLLNNPFYMGVIRIRAAGENFPGVHEPLVSPRLFGRVQTILRGKTNSCSIKHDFLYRRRLACKSCEYSLIGERQKGHVYYRCQTPGCPTTCVREEVVDQAVLDRFDRLRFSSEEKAWFRPKLSRMKLYSLDEQEKAVSALNLQFGQINDRVNRLTDAYIDRLIDKELFEQRKGALLVERADVGQRLADWQTGKHNPSDELLNFLERADGAYLAYKHGLPEERRDLLESVTSNRLVSGKTPEIMLRSPFDEIANRVENSHGAQDRTRTCTGLLPPSPQNGVYTSSTTWAKSILLSNYNGYITYFQPQPPC